VKVFILIAKMEKGGGFCSPVGCDFINLFFCLTNKLLI